MRSAAWKRATTDDTAWVTGTDDMKYDKLVRDRIPEIIRESGKECVCRVLTEAEYIGKLEEKLGEELAEYLESGSMEEIADLLEVIHAVIAARGSSMAEVETIRRNKAAARGGFAERLLLTEVRDV